MTMMCDGALREILAAASRAADQLVIGRALERRRDGIYLVPSAHSDEVYAVTLGGDGSYRASCTCPHGRRIAQGLEANGRCWHVVAAMMDDATRRPRRGRRSDPPASALALSTAA